MARKARERAESGVYYAEINGNDKLVFVENDDYRYFLELVGKVAEDDFTEICAYSLFSEKIAFVIKEGLDGISEFVRKVLPKYTARYNRKYSREGKLFFDRFKSVPLESSEEILDAVRYVHRLPVAFNEKDGLKYAFSSYNDYASGNRKDDTVMVLCGRSVQRFKTEMETEAEFLKREKRLSNAEISELVKEKLAGKTAEEIENMDEAELGRIIAWLYGLKVSIRRLALLLGVSKSAVEKSLRKYKAEQ